jgi:hypothetical protein
MVAERAKNNGRHPLEELSPGLRNAVGRVLNDPMPEELTSRALASVRHRVGQCPRKARCRILCWTGSAIAASIAVMALVAYGRAAQTVDGRSARMPVLPPAGEDIAAAFDDNLPTVWAYTKAAQSPDGLDALLDRQWRQSNSANSPLVARASVSPLSFVHAFTFTFP